MIAMSSVLRIVARQIQDYAPLNELCGQNNAGLIIYVGHPGEGDLEPQDSLVRVSVVPDETGYNLGRTGNEDRECPIRITYDLTTQATQVDGARKEYIGALLAHDVGETIIQAIYEIGCLGDALRDAILRVDVADSWPVCKGEISIVFAFERGLAFEAALE